MTDRLIKSGGIQGLRLVGRDGVKLGTIRETFVDLATGQTEYLIVEAQALLGGSGKFYPLPWHAARFDPVAGDFQANLTKDEFRAAPSYDRDQLMSSGYAWSDQASAYFSRLD